MPKYVKLTAALLLAACVNPAFAQDQGKPDSIVLETKSGSVMSSTGGDYQSADAGKQLAEGESLMLNDGAKASVAYSYDNGKRKCVEHYTGPNTYVIDNNCVKAAWLTNNPTGTALIVGGAVIAAALLAGDGDDDSPPVSAGAR